MTNESSRFARSEIVRMIMSVNVVVTSVGMTDLSCAMSVTFTILPLTIPTPFPIEGFDIAQDRLDIRFTELIEQTLNLSFQLDLLLRLLQRLHRLDSGLGRSRRTSHGRLRWICRGLLQLPK